MKDAKHADDSKITESWRIVQEFSHRHLWNVAESNNDGERPTLSYQDDSCEGFQVQRNLDNEHLDDEGNLVSKQQDDEDCLHVDAAVVDKIRSQRQEEMEENHQSDEDETGWQYAGDDEVPITPHNDDDESEEEDSDSDQ